MSSCRFMYTNFIPGPESLSVSSAQPGMVGSAASEALGSASCLAAGEHTGYLDQMMVVEIDSVQAGTEVGLATFRWKRQSAGSWEASGVPTSAKLTSLADGVSVKWVSGPGQDFYKGDHWSILATGCKGPQSLMDRDRDTGWRSQASAGQWISADLGQPQAVRSLVLADHNLSETATATLKARDTLYEPEWDHPAYSQAVEVTWPHLTCFLDESYRHWRLELDDPDNDEGMLRTSLLYLGGCFEPQRTFRAGYGQGSVATRKLVTGSGGKLAGSSGALAAYYQVEFSRLDQADAKAMEAMLAAVHGGGLGGLRPLFFTPFTDDPGSTLYCLPGAELSRQEVPGGRWNLGLRLEEVVKSDA